MTWRVILTNALSSYLHVSHGVNSTLRGKGIQTKTNVLCVKFGNFISTPNQTIHFHFSSFQMINHRINGSSFRNFNASLFDFFGKFTNHLRQISQLDAWSFLCPFFNHFLSLLHWTSLCTFCLKTWTQIILFQDCFLNI